MLNRICVLFLALVVALPVLADEDDWDNVAETAAPVQAEPAAEPTTETAAAPAAAGGSDDPSGGGLWHHHFRLHHEIP